MDSDPAVDASDRSRDEDLSPVSPTRLPVLLQHAATARESDATKSERLARLRGARATQCIRFAPPPIDAPKTSRPPIVFPRLVAGAKPRDPDTVEAESVLQAMENELQRKQTETATFFRVLYDLQQHASSGSMRSLLQQVFRLLLRAAYCASATEEPVDVDDVPELDELVGHEYFSLYTRAQQSLETISAKKQALETSVSMEQALEHELETVLAQLEHDLHAIRTQHLENHERVEAERAAIAQLEDEHAALIRQEQQLRTECDGLALQAERQHTQLSELQSKSAYLDFVSRIPLKRHLEQKKLQEQEELLRAVVLHDEAENAALERELAMLHDQMITLDEQLVSDTAHRGRLEAEVVKAEAIRNATQAEHDRLRDCHTPRPAWDAIIERIPELANNDDLLWDEMQTAMGQAPASRLQSRGDNQSTNDSDSEAEDEDDSDDGDDDDVGGQTQELVGEILQWIERLQKHCSVNLHLSRVWHDVEEARVELNILQHQLDQAVRKCTGFGGRLSGSKRAVAPRGSPDKSSRPRQEYICALGIHAEIPLFLRHQGKIKRHPLKKSELETLVRKVWTEKRQREKRNPHLHLALEDVLYERLHRSYGFQPLIAEWGYNILLSLDLFAWDAELELFLLCLTHAISDHVFIDQEKLLEACLALLMRLSTSYGNESFATERRVLLKDALVALRKFFPLKTSSQLLALEKAMIRDMHKKKRGGNDAILYIDDILAPTMAYPRGFFVKAVRQQHFKEIQDYYQTLTAELETRDENATGELPTDQVREAMHTVDPLADTNAVWSALLRGAGVKARAQLELHSVVAYKPFLRQMNSTGLLKFALNFDPHAELNWHRLAMADLSPFSTSSSGKRRQSVRRSFSAVSARSQPATSSTALEPLSELG